MPNDTRRASDHGVPDKAGRTDRVSQEGAVEPSSSTDAARPVGSLTRAGMAPRTPNMSSSPRLDRSPGSSRPLAPAADPYPSAADSYFSPSLTAQPRRYSQLATPRMMRGLTLDEVQDYHIISSSERSGEFDGLPVGEDELKRLPRKVRGYYEYLALIKEHYEEVDTLLSGDMPGAIAHSFRAPSVEPSKRRRERGKSYTKLIGELEDEVSEVNAREEGRRAGWSSPPAWNRRSSAWAVKHAMSNNGHTAAGGARAGDAGDEEEGEEANERTRLVGQAAEERREKIALLALNVNTLINFVLTAAKLVAVLYSSSISLTASLVDSALDLLSTMIIYGTSWAIRLKTDPHMYPAGKRRFEPLGVLIFSVVMIASFVQVFIESFQRVKAGDQEVVDLSALGLITMLATIGIKAVIWVWCSRIPSSGVQALAQDAENDVWLNIMSLSFPFVGQRLGIRLLDPIGGMVLSTYIIYEWIKTLLQNFANLSGRSASRDQITRVLYLVQRFNPVIEIGDVECYHIGDDYIVEIDVILPASCSMHFAHDIGETIQVMIECLDGVLRAYVHCDYSADNPRNHATREARRARDPAQPDSRDSDDEPQVDPTYSLTKKGQLDRVIEGRTM